MSTRLVKAAKVAARSRLVAWSVLAATVLFLGALAWA